MITSCGFMVCAQFLGLRPEDLVYIVSSRLNEEVPVAQAQKVLGYVFMNEEGRRLFADFFGLLARAVADKPAVIGIELMHARREAFSHARARGEIF